MSSGWKLVATLSGLGAAYPLILVDNHGWCLRLGPSTRQDDKYYFSFSRLLQGLVEHFLRRRTKSNDVLEGFQALARGVGDAIREAGELSTTAKESVIHAHIRRCGALEGAGPDPMAQILPERVKSPNRPRHREPVATP